MLNGSAEVCVFNKKNSYFLMTFSQKRKNSSYFLVLFMLKSDSFGKICTPENWQKDAWHCEFLDFLIQEMSYAANLYNIMIESDSSCSGVRAVTDL